MQSERQGAARRILHPSVLPADGEAFAGTGGGAMGAGRGVLFQVHFLTAASFLPLRSHWCADLGPSWVQGSGVGVWRRRAWPLLSPARVSALLLGSPLASLPSLPAFSTIKGKAEPTPGVQGPPAHPCLPPSAEGCQAGVVSDLGQLS